MAMDNRDLFKFHFILPVWGKEFTDLFLNYALPSHLSPGNLGSLGEFGPHSCYRIYTDNVCEEQIRRSSKFQKLSAMVPTEFCQIDELLSTYKDRIFSVELACHQHAIQEAEKQDAGIVIINPDNVWADGSFRSMINHVKNGKFAVLAPTVRTNLEPFLPIFDASRGDGPVLAMHPREMVRHSLDHLHALSKGCCYGSRKYTLWSGHLYWPIGNDGLVARIFYSHLLYCRPQKKGFLPNISYDYDWMWRALPNFDDYQMITDSDDAYAASLTPTLAPGWMPDQKNYSNTVTLVRRAHWVRDHAGAFNHNYFKSVIRIHACPINDDWLEQERRTLEIAERFYEYLISPNIFLDWTFYHLGGGIHRLLSNIYNRTRLALGPYVPRDLRRKLKHLAENVIGLRVS